MGRYYSGDINGKFWFGVQNSDDASFFGGSESTPNFINYYFEKENDMTSILESIEKCKVALGEFEKKFDKFFKEHNGYNDEMLVKEFGISAEKTRELLLWYARLLLGEKIKKCVEKKGYCEFEAEV